MEIHSKGTCYTVTVKTPDGKNHEYDDDHFSFRFRLPHDIKNIMVFDSISTATSWIRDQGMEEKDFVYDEYYFMATHPETGDKYIMNTTSIFSETDEPLGLIAGTDNEALDDVVIASVKRRIKKLTNTFFCSRLKSNIKKLNEYIKWVNVYPELRPIYDEALSLMEADKYGMLMKGDKANVQ